MQQQQQQHVMDAFLDAARDWEADWAGVCDTHPLDESESWWASSDNLLPWGSNDDLLSEGTQCVSQPVSPRDEVLKVSASTPYTIDNRQMENVQLEKGCDVYFKRPIKVEHVHQHQHEEQHFDNALHFGFFDEPAHHYQPQQSVGVKHERDVSIKLENDDLDFYPMQQPQQQQQPTLKRRRVEPVMMSSSSRASSESSHSTAMVSAAPSMPSACIELSRGVGVPSTLSEIHPNSIDLNPRDFQSLLRALGAQLVERPSPDHPHRVELLPPDVVAATLPEPRTDRIRYIQPDKTFVMSSTVPLKDRRRYDSFCDQTLESGETTFWCDQGNAHCMLDCSKPLQESSIDGKHVNPRTIQVAHALARRVSGLTQMERPVIKSFYYALCARPSSKSNARKTKGSLSGSWPLGLHKHIYVLCDQSVNDRHKILNGSQIWLVRYFVKGKLHAELDRFLV